MTTPRATWSMGHPSSATSLTSTTTRTKPAPIYNPYDKFTKPQFDAWIDDLTGTLRRALGHIDDTAREESPVGLDESSMGQIDAEQASESEDIDGEVEDSFAELKARRASRKGKGRDPREGPGLFSGRGNGSYEEPIDLASDSEDEEAQVEDLARVIDDTDEGSEWEERDDHKQSEQDAEDVEAEAEAEVEYEREGDYEEVESALGEEDEVYDEHEEEEQSDLWRSDQSYSPPVQYEVLDGDDEDYVEKSDEPEVIELLSDEEVSIGGSSLPAQAESEEDSDTDVHEEDQDQDVHEDAAASPEIYDVDDDDDEQPLYDDTAFPPTALDHPFQHENIEIVDPWVRPQIYADDLYKGGDHLPNPGTHPSPHKLGDADDSTSITPQHEMDEHMAVFEASRDEFPEAASHLRFQLIDASYIQYDPDTIDVDSNNAEEPNVHPDDAKAISPDSNADVSYCHADERHPDTTTDSNHAIAPSINPEEPSNDNVQDPSLSTGDIHGQGDESIICAVSLELATSEKQLEEPSIVPLVNQPEGIVVDLYENLKTETDGLIVEVSGQPLSGPVLYDGDVGNIQDFLDVPMNPEVVPQEDRESEPPRPFIESDLDPEVSTVAELETPQHLDPDIACVAGLTHHQPFELELSLAEGQSLPQHVTTDIVPAAGLKELHQDDRDGEEPVFLPTPPADEHTITPEAISLAQSQVDGVLDDTGAADALEQQETKDELSFVPDAVGHDTMDTHDENLKSLGFDNPVVVSEPAVRHIDTVADTAVEPNDDYGGEVVAPRAADFLDHVGSPSPSAPCKVNECHVLQEVIATDDDNHPTVVPHSLADGAQDLVEDDPTILVDYTPATLNVDTDKVPVAEESPIPTTGERCTVSVNDGPADAIGDKSTALGYGNLTPPFTDGFDLPSEVAFGDSSEVPVNDNSDVRVDDSSSLSIYKSTALVDDGAAVTDEQEPSSSSGRLDTIETGPLDALVSTDEAHTVDADMIVEVLPQSPHDIEVVDAKIPTDPLFTVSLPDIASSPPATSGSPAPADPHTPPLPPQTQTGVSPLFTPRTYIKRRPPGLMTTPPSSEGDTSDDVRSPSQHDGEENQRGQDSKPEIVCDQSEDQIIMDSQDALTEMNPSASIRSPGLPRESLTRTLHVAPTVSARAVSVLQPDPYPYSLSTPGVAQYLSKSGSDEVSEDENDLSNTSSSSNDRELESSNQDFSEQSISDSSLGGHVQSEKPSISTNIHIFKDGIPGPQPSNFSDNPDLTGPLSTIEDLTVIESSLKKINGVSSITPPPIPQMAFKTDIRSAEYHSQETSNPESPSVDGNDPQGSTSTKRKRTSSGPKRLSHTLSSKRKGKQKEDPNGSPAPSDATSPGGLAAKLLTYSRKSSVSRASSSTPSEVSISTSQVPPTPTKPANGPRHPPIHYPPALLHGHSSQPRSLRHQHHLPTAGTSRASSTSSLDRPHYYSSPVTRSNCRYRRISLPKVDNGPRISFLVPGCSLGDAELMEDEEIVDHGDATTEESRRVVPDIENLDFSPYLIGVLRQLVGVDLLREQEVYYLCAVGEDPRLVQKRKADRFTLNQIGESSNSPRPPSESVRSPASSIRPPASAASGISTTPPRAVVKKEDDLYESSISFSTIESQTEVPTPSPAKRQKRSVNTPPASASTSRTRMKSATKRSSKPIAYISAPVVPVPEEEFSDLSGSELPFDHRLKARRVKSLKRTRTDVRVDEEESRRFKRLKARLSDTH